MIRVNIQLTVTTRLDMNCLYEVRKVIQTSSQQAIDDLSLPEVCPDLPDVQITNTTGVLKIENNTVSMYICTCILKSSHSRHYQ